MAIVSDANVLSSLAAANVLDLLAKVFVEDKVFIPPAVEQELQTGLAYGKTHIERIFKAIERGDIQVLPLTETERNLIKSLPRQLHAGEREGIILCQLHNHLFLSNDKRAIRYCQTSGITAVNLEAFLRLVWLNKILSQNQVKALIKQMEVAENLILKPDQQAKIFAPRSHHRKS